jgi:hypothetical protein
VRVVVLICYHDVLLAPFLYGAELAETDLEDAHTCIAALGAEIKALKVILELCF